MLTAATIRRKTYALGGQPVATRATGYPAGETGKNGRFYMHSDHLGSNSVMSYGQGHSSSLFGKEAAGNHGRYDCFVYDTISDIIWRSSKRAGNWQAKG
jgi:hypothetical protein